MFVSFKIFNFLNIIKNFFTGLHGHLNNNLNKFHSSFSNRDKPDMHEGFCLQQPTPSYLLFLRCVIALRIRYPSRFLLCVFNQHLMDASSNIFTNRNEGISYFKFKKLKKEHKKTNVKLKYNPSSTNQKKNKY